MCVLRLPAFSTGPSLRVITFDGIHDTINNFQPRMLNLCNFLEELDISYGVNVNANLFVQSVTSCRNLKIFKFRNCTQFSESQITQMLSKLVTLVYVDGCKTQPVRFCNFLLIICSINKLNCIGLEPKYGSLEQKDWARLVRNYPITFSHSIREILPFYGWGKC